MSLKCSPLNQTMARMQLASSSAMALVAAKALKWDDRLADACGCEGIVLRDDESDGTAQVGS